MIGVTDDWVRWRFTNLHEPLGEFGEALWSNLLRGSGLFYIPLKDLPAINGKGPRLQGSDAILPDFHVNGMRNAFVDSKCKSGPVMYFKANELRQGVDRKCWESYQAISEIQRQKCVLAIAEIFTRCDQQREGREWSGALLMQTLGRLGPPISGFNTMEHMVLWPRAKFVELVPGTSPLRLWELAKQNRQVDDDLRDAIRRVIESREDIQGRFA